jgi:uncharacterized protein (DUF433 family)
MTATAVGVSKEHITKTPGVCGGKACIAGTRIRVQDVMGQYEHGMAPADIANYFTTKLSLSDVYDAIVYGMDHAEDRRKAAEFVEEFFRDRPSILEQKIQTARESRGG